jgi:hypothetical protein
MKYLCLVYGEEDKIATVNDHECLACDASLRASGHCIASEALESVATATTVRHATAACPSPTDRSRRPRSSSRAST